MIPGRQYRRGRGCVCGGMGGGEGVETRREEGGGSGWWWEGEREGRGGPGHEGRGQRRGLGGRGPSTGSWNVCAPPALRLKHFLPVGSVCPENMRNELFLALNSARNIRIAH